MEVQQLVLIHHHRLQQTHYVAGVVCGCGGCGGYVVVVVVWLWWLCGCGGFGGWGSCVVVVVGIVSAIVRWLGLFGGSF